MKRCSDPVYLVRNNADHGRMRGSRMGSTTTHCSVCESVVFLVIIRILMEYLT